MERSEEEKGIREKRLKGNGGRDEGTGRWAKEETGRRAKEETEKGEKDDWEDG